MDRRENKDFVHLQVRSLDLVIITRPEYIHTGVYMYVSGCLWAYISSYMSWIWLSVCLCLREREWASLTVFRSVILRYCGAWSLLFVLWWCIAELYRMVFLIGFDVLQPMCTDRGCFGKPQSISAITAVAVKLTFWICYSPLFKLVHSLISCPWFACTLSQACTQCRLCTVCLLQSSGAVWVGLRMKNQVWIGNSSKFVRNGDY